MSYRRVALQHLVDRVELMAGDGADQVARDAGVMVQHDASVPLRAHRQFLGWQA